MVDETEHASSRRRRTMGSRILLGVLAGVACGVFLGDLSEPFEVAGQVYIGLLQMTVLPYVAVTLLTKIGRLTFDSAKRLAGRAGGVQLLLWAVSLSAVMIMPLSLPSWEAGTFFSSSLVERPPEFDFLGLYIPVNPFHALANNAIPAVVLFSILVGVATIGIPEKGKLLVPLSVFSDALERISNSVIRLAPYGTFALAAGAAGKMSADDLLRLGSYISTYVIGVVVLTFVVLPGLVGACSPYSMRRVLGATRGALLTAFATGKLFAVLPMVVVAVRDLLVEEGVPEEEARGSADVLVPLCYPFPNSGKILSIFFVPFAAWYVGQPLELADYPMLLGAGVLSFFGSPLIAIPFLLDLLRLPADLVALFLIAGIWCARVGDVLGAMHLVVFALLSDAWGRGWLALRPARITKWLAASVVVGALAIAANFFLVEAGLRSLPAVQERVAGWDLLLEQTPIVEKDVAAPHPVALASGETRVQRARRTGFLRAGFVPDNPPFSYRNERGAIVGLDVDLAQGLAADLGVSLQLVPYRPAELATALEADHFELAMGGIASTIESYGRYHETSPYLELHLAIVVPDHRAREFQRIADVRKMPSLHLACVEGSPILQRAPRMPGLEIEVIPTAEAFLTGQTPNMDALLTTAETGSIYCMLHPEFSVVVPEGIEAKVPLVFAVQRARELDGLIDTWIRLKRADGTIDELFDHWILGRQPEESTRRWSVIRDVLGWVR